ncbi:MAG TPA: 6-carboxytetrahydropterin synthase [Bryobacteraceae bacterium]|nr:6-carboxytetrahydropterin synthase [Bryobacteraceae bacterium]
MIRLTRRYRFSASHRLHSNSFSDDENQRLFGKCNNPFGHGHNYVLDVSVTGAVDERTGRLVSTGALDRLVRGEVITRFDHADFNRDVPEFSEAIPTSENILQSIEQRLRWAWHKEFPEGGPALAGLRLQETKKNIFELRS